jgi:DNA-directed RNA polymerase subunit RPC12/RpoP
MSRKLNQINLEPGSACWHCERTFERPYERMPEFEGTSGKAVLRCPDCGCFTIFETRE